jgi:IMP dehydrogenase
MGYAGAATIRNLKLDGRLIQITFAGLQESHPHDVHHIADAPNYSNVKSGSGANEGGRA